MDDMTFKLGDKVWIEPEGNFMNPENKTSVVTGGASGIGAALCKALANKGANVVVSDINEAAAAALAKEIGGTSFKCNVRNETEICDLVSFAEQQYGQIDLFCSNAGLAFGEPSHAASATNEQWQTCWDVHVMAHVYASRAVLPSMIARKEGYLVNIASAAGLLCQVGDAAYSATKHAAVSLAESLAITHKSDGITVSVVCPQYVATPLTGYDEVGASNEEIGVLSAENVADTIVQGIEADRFMIHTHPDVKGYFQARAGDHDSWIAGMQRMREKIIEKVGSTRLEDMHKMFSGK